MMAPNMTTRCVPRWAVDRVEVVDHTTTTPLRGGAWLLGAGVRAFCADTDGRVAVLEVTADDAGRLVATSVTVTAGPVTSVVLRTLPVTRLVREAFASLDDADWAAHRAVDEPARIDAVVDTWRAVQGTIDAHRAIAATAERLALSRGYVARLLARARAEGLLPR